MKRMIIEVEDGVDINELLKILEDVNIHESFILGMKVEVDKE